MELGVKNFIYLSFKPSDGEKGSIVIYTSNGSIPTWKNYKCDQTIDIKQDSRLLARTVKHGMLDSDILEVIITIKIDRTAENKNMNHPEEMERPIFTSNTDEGFDFDNSDGLWFQDNAFESYHG